MGKLETSKDGWMNQIFWDTLNCIHLNFAGWFPCALILDCYKAHRTSEE